MHRFLPQHEHAHMDVRLNNITANQSQGCSPGPPQRTMCRRACFEEPHQHWRQESIKFCHHHPGDTVSCRPRSSMQLSSASDTHYRLTASARRRTLPAAARLHAVAAAGGASRPHHQPQQSGPRTAHIARVATPEVVSVCLDAFGAHTCSPGRLTAVHFSFQETTIRNTGQDGEHSSGHDVAQQLHGGRRDATAAADGFQPITAM